MSRFQTETLRQKLYICYIYIYSVMESNVLILFEIPLYIIILNLNISLLWYNTWPHISLFWEEFGPSFKKKQITVTPDTLCQDWLNLAQWFWRKRFLEVGKVFLLFLNYFSLVEGLGLHLNNLNSLYSRMIYTKFGLNWLSSSGGKDFQKSQCVFTMS